MERSNWFDNNPKIQAALSLRFYNKELYIVYHASYGLDLKILEA